jgi:glutathione synthase
MVHLDSAPNAKPEIKQVEFNTIASSFGGLSTKAARLHKQMMQDDVYREHISLQAKDKEMFPIEISTNAIKGLADGMWRAHTAYEEQNKSLDKKTESPNVHVLSLCILFIVQDGETNIYDQRHIEYRLRENDVNVYRLTFSDIHKYTYLKDTDRSLIYRPPHMPQNESEVSVVYFRAGYSPTEYLDESYWEARKHLEMSRAIKCPTVLTQLAGLKKVQQVLATPGSNHLERFIGHGENTESIRRTFVPMYPMDTTEAGLEGRKLATNPDTAKHYVLKPQREGGGNNIYRDAIPQFLKSISEEQWEAYVLMEMIEPPEQSNVILRHGQIRKGKVICELGMYGACLWEEPKGDEMKILYSAKAGFLLRTKGSDSSEGGVAAGFGALDSPLLVEDDAIRG